MHSRTLEIKKINKSCFKLYRRRQTRTHSAHSPSCEFFGLWGSARNFFYEFHTHKRKRLRRVFPVAGLFNDNNLCWKYRIIIIIISRIVRVQCHRHARRGRTTKARQIIDIMRAHKERSLFLTFFLSVTIRYCLLRVCWNIIYFLFLSFFFRSCRLSTYPLCATAITTQNANLTIEK